MIHRPQTRTQRKHFTRKYRRPLALLRILNMCQKIKTVAIVEAKYDCCIRPDHFVV